MPGASTSAISSSRLTTPTRPCRIELPQRAWGVRGVTKDQQVNIPLGHGSESMATVELLKKTLADVLGLQR